MAKAYSDDLRLRAINLMKKETKTKVAELLGITIQTLCKWWKLYTQSNILIPKVPTFERKKKVNYNEIEIFINKYPDKTLKEVGNVFGVSG
jgi:transposase